MSMIVMYIGVIVGYSLVIYYGYKAGMYCMSWLLRD